MIIRQPILYRKSEEEIDKILDKNWFRIIIV